LLPNNPRRKKEGAILLLRLPWNFPGRNLAVEEYILDEGGAVRGGSSVLLVYENSEALIIGKNQNPWREIALPVLQSGSPRFFRRVSGGGAVWHGPGNLNFSFIADRGSFSKGENLDFVRRALYRLGLPVEMTARGDFAAGGKKLSGNALCYRKSRALHHGTILVDAPPDRVVRCLTPDGPPGCAIETRAIASVPMPVTNLKELLPTVTSGLVIEALFDEARTGYEEAFAVEVTDGFFPSEKLRVLEDRHNSWEWLYGATPSFTCKLGDRVFSVRDGIVTATGQRFSPCPCPCP
jgi:lipoate-protein ligase A